MPGYDHGPGFPPTAEQSMDSFTAGLPQAWADVLRDELRSDYFGELRDFIAAERRRHEVFPPAAETFAAFELTPPDGVRAVILGQDPYHGPGQAHGLSFSVREGVALPPSLRNIYRELGDDLGRTSPSTGDLSSWARQGVLLLNATLTVRRGAAGSHQGHGWERFTDAVLHCVAEHNPDAVFMLWGAWAQKKRRLAGGCPVLCTTHPSPLSAYRGFLGSRPFSTCNEALRRAGQEPIDWLATAPAAALPSPEPGDLE